MDLTSAMNQEKVNVHMCRMMKCGKIFFAQIAIGTILVTMLYPAV